MPMMIQLPGLGETSLYYAFRNTDVLGQSIVVVLFIFSIITWCIMFDKGISLKCALRDSAAFLAKFRSKRNPLAFSDRIEEEPSPAARVCEAAYLRIQQMNIELPNGTRRSLTFSEIDIVRATLEQAVADQIVVLEQKMIFLATAVSISPFLGLFGTVWGIMLAFTELAIAGKADIQTLAPGVSGALLTTVLGLIVAIPSVAGYNIITSQIKSTIVHLDNFVEEFIVKLKIECLNQQEQDKHDKLEKDRISQLEQARQEHERLKQQEQNRQEQERIRQQEQAKREEELKQQELERLRQQEQVRQEHERLKQQELERLRQQEMVRQEQERLKQLELLKQEHERMKQQEQERIRQEEQERILQQEQERLRLQEQERLKQQEMARQEQERLRLQEQERLKQQEMARQEQERLRLQEQANQETLPASEEDFEKPESVLNVSEPPRFVRPEQMPALDEPANPVSEPGHMQTAVGSELARPEQPDLNQWVAKNDSDTPRV